METMKKNVKTRKMAVMGMLLAIMLILMLTPLGYIPIGPLKATIMHLPVIIGAILEGPIVGMALGLIFGITSMIQAVIAPTPLSFIFLNPVVAVLPRVLIGLVAYGVYRLTKSSILSAVAGTATNTIGVMGLIYLLYAQRYIEIIGGNTATAGKIIAVAGATNGIPECIVAAAVVGAVVTAVKKYVKSNR